MTKQITKFDKVNLVDVRNAMKVALAALETDLGVKIDVGNISFNENSFKCGLSAILSTAVSDPYLSDVPAEYIHALKKYRGYENSLLRKVSVGPVQWVIVGRKEECYIAKHDNDPQGKMFCLTSKIGDRLDCQVRGVSYNSLINGG